MENQFQKDTTATGETTQSVFINENTRREYIQLLRQKQNLPLGFAAGLGAAFVGAFLWLVITVWTGYQITYMPIGIGIGVGFAIHFFGKGVDIIFALIGGVLSLLGCLLGDFLSIYGFLADNYNLGYVEVFEKVDFDIALTTFTSNIDFMSVVFYGVAIIAGFLSARNLPTDKELLEYVEQKQNEVSS